MFQSQAVILKQQLIKWETDQGDMVKENKISVHPRDDLSLFLSDFQFKYKKYFRFVQWTLTYLKLTKN